MNSSVFVMVASILMVLIASISVFFVIKLSKEVKECKKNNDTLFSELASVIMRYGGKVRLSRWDIVELDDMDKVDICVNRYGDIFEFTLRDSVYNTPIPLQENPDYEGLGYDDN